MTQPERAKVIFTVISSSWKKRTEQAMLGKENEDGGKDGKIRILPVFFSIVKGIKKRNAGITMLPRRVSRIASMHKKRSKKNRRRRRKNRTKRKMMALPPFLLLMEVVEVCLIKEQLCSCHRRRN
jgi:hypothetical protein